MGVLFLEFPPPPKFLPIVVREEGHFTVRIYHYPHRRQGSQWGWSVYLGGGRIGFGLRATSESVEAAAKRSIDTVERDGVRMPGRQRAHSTPRGSAPAGLGLVAPAAASSDQGRRPDPCRRRRC